MGIGSKRFRDARATSKLGRKRKLADHSTSDFSSGEAERSSRNVTEEEIAEYMAKKAHKIATKVAKRLKAAESVVSAGYPNESNPFGDSNLSENFVWRKKIDRDVSQGMPLDEFSVRAEKKRHKERIAEIEKVKKRREERAIEKAKREEETAMLARERARAEFQDWEKKDQEFEFEQSKIRSEIRVREGRAKPIDLLSKHLTTDEPYTVFKGLTVEEMEELRDEIKMHLDMERARQARGDDPDRAEYWEALLVVCNEELAELLAEEERALHFGIESDVRDLLEGKTSRELNEVESKVELMLSSGEAMVVEYWQAVLKRLQIYKAKAVLKQIHAKMMLQTDLKRLDELESNRDDLRPIHKENVGETKEAEEEEEEAGSLSPQLLLYGDGNEEEAVDPEQDNAMLERKRMAVLEEQLRRVREAVDPEQDKAILEMQRMAVLEEQLRRVREAMMREEGDEVELAPQVYLWQDKYRPRKPKYFNKVHTGYVWNKYNRTHYDHDNPPPKFVQGYKFNIFYPDLVDKARAPSYTIDKDGDGGETCIIRFHAGPPYEDIAFRIVNKDWEYSTKKGFKCTFERGILHLYFNFKRHPYRR